MRVSIIGAGYVGLVTAACLAEKGHDVVCVDVDAAKVRAVNAAVSPIYERGLDALLRRNVPTRLRATRDVRRAVAETDLSLIAVGTPTANGAIDIQPIRAAAEAIGAAMGEKAEYHVVAVKSTVVPRTTVDVVLPILEDASAKAAGRDFGVAANPEFLREGRAVGDFMSPDRIVLGAIDERTMATLVDLYGPFDGAEVLRTNPTTAEAIKYASNALLATMVSFANEVGNLCTALGDVDAMDVMRGVHLSRNLMLPGGRAAPISSYLIPGCGFGGSCLPKDVAALVAHGRQRGRRMALLEAVLEVNVGQPREVLALLKRNLPQLEGARISVLGLAFKPECDDVRDSPALPIIDLLLDEGALVTAYDPAVREVERLRARVASAPTLRDAVRDADAVLLVTRWQEFEALPDVLRDLEHHTLVVDARRMLDPRSVERYDAIGRGTPAGAGDIGPARRPLRRSEPSRLARQGG